jgi:adenylate kinase
VTSNPKGYVLLIYFQTLVEAQASEERESKEREEYERRKKIAAEWQIKLEQSQKQEKDILEIQSEPLRSYVVKELMPELTAGLMLVAKERPSDPIDFLAEFLYKKAEEKRNQNQNV